MQKSTSKLNKLDSESYSTWSLPDVQGSHVVSSREEAGAAEAGLQRNIQEKKHARGYEEGYREGMQKAAAEVSKYEQQLKKSIAMMSQLIESLNEPFEKLDQDVEQELVALAVAMAKQIIRREITTDPGQIMAVVREALNVLPVSSRNITIAMHPEDAALISQLEISPREGRQWRLVEDPGLLRGGCMVSTDTSRIDASVENRLAVIFSQIVGGEREQDRT